MRTIAIAGAGAEGLRAALPSAVHELLDLRYVVPEGRKVAAVVDEVLGTVGDEPSLLFGHSMNGTLALAVAAAGGPARITGVIAVGSPPSLPLDLQAMRAHWIANAEPERRRRFDERSRRAAEATDDDERGRWIAAADQLRAWHDLDVDPSPIEARYERTDTAAWAASIFTDSVTVDWQRIRTNQPGGVFLVLGRSDYLVPCTSWDGIATSPSTFTKVTFDRSAHSPFVEEPERFADELRDWLATTNR